MSSPLYVPPGFESGLNSQRKAGMDPVTIGLMAASALGGLFGGESDQQKRRSFHGTAVDPVLTLRDTLDSIKRLGMALPGTGQQQVGVRLKSPAPINIPGVPFQIGGGMASDPGIGDPRMVNPFELASQIFKPMQGQAGDGSQGLAGLKDSGSGVSGWAYATNPDARKRANEAIAAKQAQGPRL